MFRALVLVGLLATSAAVAGPGDYSLRVKGGPAFNLQDWENQFRLGGEFDYDFGFHLGFNLAALMGFSDTFRFDLIPSVRYDYLYIGPASLYGLFGIGYAALDGQNALDMRFGTGLTLPLGDRFEFNTDIDLFLTPAGTPGTPTTLEWLIGFGTRSH